jgi:flagellar basal-body rod protein FlgG
MLNGIYSAAAGMAAQQSRIDALSNDIANVNTVGYKSQRVGFRDLVYSDGDVRVGAGSAQVDVGRSLRQGVLTDANDPLAVAIEGDGYFQVLQNDGTLALTRAGNFRLDAQGMLVTATGERLAPPIAIPAGTPSADIGIAANGTVTVRDREVGRLVVVDVPAPSALAPAGNGMFTPTAGSGAAAPANGQVRQGFYEASNVDLGTAMVELITSQRGFELTSRAIQTADRLMEMANSIRR